MAEKVTITGVVSAKAGNGKGFKLNGHENWFSANYCAGELAVVAKGDTVEIVYEKKGIYFNVSKITKKETVVAPTCEDCGTILKDAKFKKCYACNQKAKDVKVTPITEPKSEVTTQVQSTNNFTSDSKYGSPEDVAGKEVGCAAGCAAQILAGAGCGVDTETLLQTFGVLFKGILDQIRANK